MTAILPISSLGMFTVVRSGEEVWDKAVLSMEMTDILGFFPVLLLSLMSAAGRGADSALRAPDAVMSLAQNTAVISCCRSSRMARKPLSKVWSVERI